MRQKVPQPAPPASPCIELRGVCRTFATPAGPVTGLHPLDLAVPQGAFVAVTGPSGSGKSTLLNLLTAIDRPSAGELHVAGAALHRLDEPAAARWRGQSVGIVFQFFQLLPNLTALENVLLPMELAGVCPRGERRERAHDLLQRVGLHTQAGRRPDQLSGGQQQRVAIARALANDPPLLVADEPTGNLDSATAAVVFDLFTALAAAGKTVLLVTHDPALARRANRIVHLADGRLVSDTTRAALPFIAELSQEVAYV